MGTREEQPEVENHPINRPLAHCPVCGSENLDPVVENERQTVHFLCRDCSRCWHVELGYVHRMTPAACLGCPERDRCQLALEADREQNRI
jgi:transposase-like protein